MRLFLTYGASLLMKLVLPRRFQSVGYLIPGKSNLTVSISGLLANVRPRTPDLAIFASSNEAQTAGWFKVRPGEVVVDVGAHIGRYTLVAARKTSKVIAIEPEPSNFSMLKSNIRLNGFSNVVALPLALTMNQGRVPMYIPVSGNTAASSIDRTWSKRGDKPQNTKVVEVEGDTLDNLMAPLGLRVIDWLKIDVEGHEVAVLQGALKALRRTKRVILEVSQGNEVVCRDLLKSAGFTLMATEEVNVYASNWLLVNETAIKE